MRKEQDQWRREVEKKGIRQGELRRVKVDKPTLLYPRFKQNAVYQLRKEHPSSLHVENWEI